MYGRIGTLIPGGPSKFQKVMIDVMIEEVSVPVRQAYFCF
jgi:hypothetical protein